MLPVFVTGRGCPHALWPKKIEPRRASTLAHLPGCRASSTPLTGGRRPQGTPRRLPATVWQPFGLAAQECSASKGRRDACPTLRMCLGHSAPTRGGCAAANEDGEWRVEGGKARRCGDSCARTRNLDRNGRVCGEGRMQKGGAKPPKATRKPPGGEGRMQNAECRKERQSCPKAPTSHSKATPKPGTGQVLARCKAGALLCCSCVALVLLLFCRHCSGFPAPPAQHRCYGSVFFGQGCGSNVPTGLDALGGVRVTRPASFR